MAERWPIHTVVFDLDDTLYAEADFVRSGFRAVDHWLERHEGVRGFAAAAVRHFDAGLRGRIFDAALADLQMPSPAERVAQLVEVYRAHTPEISLSPDVEQLLGALASRHHLALLTDGYARVQRNKIAALGLARWIGCLVVTDELGRECWKPHPAGFERIMTHFGGEPAGFLYVGDNPRKDFLAPKRLGWRTVRLVQTGQEHVGYRPTAAEAAEAEIQSLPQLSLLLQPEKAGI